MTGVSQRSVKIKSDMGNQKNPPLSKQYANGTIGTNDSEPNGGENMYPTQTYRAKMKLLATVLLPLLVYQLAHFSAQFVDTIMTGQYSEIHLAGVSLAGNLWAPFFTFVTGTVSAVIPIAGQHLGRQQHGAIASTVRQFLYIGLLLAAGLWALILLGAPIVLQHMQLDNTVYHVAMSYLQYLALGVIPLVLFSVLRSFIDALGLTRISMMLLILVVPFNVGFNYILIYGRFGLPELGGAGAGLGTALAYWALLFVVVAVIQGHPRLSSYRIWQFEPPHFQQWASGLRLGIPIGLAVFMEVGLFAFVGLLMAQYPANVIAAHQAAMNFSNLAYAFPTSISSTLTIMIAYEVGRQDHRSAKQYLLLGLLLSFAIALCTLGGVFWQRTAVARMYGSSDEFLQLTTVFLSYSLLFQLFDAGGAPIQGALRGYKDTKIPFALTIAGFWGVGLTIGVGLHQWSDLGPYSYWVGLIAGLLANFLFLSVRLRYVLRAQKKEC